jgi:hypothetical protein
MDIRVVMLHTTQARPDYMGADFNAEKTANWLTSSTRQASYHHITDRDSEVPFINPFLYRAWGCRTIDGIRWNDFTFHQSMSTKAEEYRDDEGWIPTGFDPDDWMANPKSQYVLRGALCSARAVLTFDVPIRLVTPSEVAKGHGGFVTHGMADPTRRFDPGFSDHELGVYIQLVEELVNPPLDKAVAVIGDPDRGPDQRGRWPFWAVYPNGRVVSHNGARVVSDLIKLGVTPNQEVEGADLRRDGEAQALVLYSPADGGSFRLSL